jgi:hypothetical protein
MRRFPDAAYLASLLNCGIFRRLWRSRVQITADPDRFHPSPSRADKHSVRVSIRSLPIAALCVQSIVLRASLRPSVDRSLAPQRRRSSAAQCSKKCRCNSLPPSSEPPDFEHREPDRDANGAIKGDPGDRGERGYCVLIDADYRQRGQGHEHLGPPPAFRGSNRAIPALIIEVKAEADLGLRHHRDLIARASKAAWPPPGNAFAPPAATAQTDAA